MLNRKKEKRMIKVWEPKLIDDNNYLRLREVEKDIVALEVIDYRDVLKGTILYINMKDGYIKMEEDVPANLGFLLNKKNEVLIRNRKRKSNE